MKRTTPRVAATLALGILATALTACSGAPASYSSPEALKSAYVDAGGACDKTLEVGEDMLSEGAHGVFCGFTILIVFDDEDAKNRYLARTGDVESYTVSGERWLASGDDRDVLDKLGGSPVE
ncbi:hypothetical protein [Microbacterium sp. LWH10-1.2]|uniref:hypothetical protein n=1 Tax=Microbacterium sp. LWH10-1.2 TaxID=3135255 RepID=UPI00313A2488